MTREKDVGRDPERMVTERRGGHSTGKTHGGKRSSLGYLVEEREHAGPKSSMRGCSKREANVLPEIIQNHPQSLKSIYNFSSFLSQIEPKFGQKEQKRNFYNRVLGGRP